MCTYLELCLGGALSQKCVYQCMKLLYLCLSVIWCLEVCLFLCMTLHFYPLCVVVLFTLMWPCVLFFLHYQSVLLSVIASLFLLLHGSEHAAVLSVPPAAVWLASCCFLSWIMPPVCVAFTRHLCALFSVHSLPIARIQTWINQSFRCKHQCNLQSSISGSKIIHIWINVFY